MTPSSSTRELSVVDYWALYMASWPGLLDHPDPMVRWKAHRYAGRVFARLARRFGSYITARDRPTLLSHPAQPKTAAAFAPLPAHLEQPFRAALAAAVGARVPRFV